MERLKPALPSSGLTREQIFTQPVTAGALGAHLPFAEIAPQLGGGEYDSQGMGVAS
jgi:hypothetical protein